MLTVFALTIASWGVISPAARAVSVAASVLPCGDQ
uniref:Uncharacterized protein n=1 Tax=Sinorhizobium meliloti (strain SM11) TaxID=707241 RepID=Q1WLD7_SINMM|nr:hypothetical protein [Sinorhizobium meliloti]